MGMGRLRALALLLAGLSLSVGSMATRSAMVAHAATPVPGTTFAGTFNVPGTSTVFGSITFTIAADGQAITNLHMLTPWQSGQPNGCQWRLNSKGLGDVPLDPTTGNIDYRIVNSGPEEPGNALRILGWFNSSTQAYGNVQVVITPQNAKNTEGCSGSLVWSADATQPATQPTQPLKVDSLLVTSPPSMGQCYTVEATVENPNTVGSLSQTISIREQPQYFGYAAKLSGTNIVLLPSTTPSSHTPAVDIQIPCTSNGGGAGLLGSLFGSGIDQGATAGSNLTRTVTLQHGERQIVTFQLAHIWSWAGEPNAFEQIISDAVGSLFGAIPRGFGTGFSIAGVATDIINEATLPLLPQARYTYSIDNPSISAGGSMSGYSSNTVTFWKQKSMELSVEDEIASLLVCHDENPALDIAVGLVCGLSSDVFKDIGADPSPDYTQPVVPPVLIIPEISALPPGPEQDCGTAIISALSYLEASRDAAVEAMGALDAGDKPWYTAQLAAAKQFLEQGAGVISAIAECPATTAARYDTASGLSADQRTVLAEAGMNPSAIDALDRAMRQVPQQLVDSVTADPNAGSDIITTVIDGLHSAAAAIQPIQYSAGWNLVAAPSGSLIPGNHGALYTVQAGDSVYEVVPPDGAAQSNYGYWTYFASPEVSDIGGSDTLPTSVRLPAGVWVMIGNSSSAQEVVQGADVVYIYDPTSGYQQTTTLQPGQGALAYSAAGTTVQLIANAAPTSLP